MKIAEMTVADMARIHGQCFSTPRPWRAAELADLIAHPSVFVLSEPAGFLIGRVVLDEAELLTLAVSTQARRAGTGRRLVAGFLDRARARGAQRAFLEVAADNAAARGLYAAQGFVVAGRRKGYYHTPEGSQIDAVLLSRMLSDSASAH